LLSLFLLLFLAPAAQVAPAYKASLVVAQDGSGDFKTVQEAVNSVRDLFDRRVTIHIRRGVYREKVTIPSWKTCLSLVGDDADSTIISWDDFSGKANPGGRDAFGNAKFSTYRSYTLLVQGNDVVVENLTIRNGAGRVGQAVALHVEGDRVVIRNCRLLGNQDTLYAAREGSRQYYAGCYIEGTTDFIFGEAVAVFDRCTVKSLTSSYITAAATRAGQAFGFVFFDCRLVADTAAKVYLGRPWRPYARTVFIRCELGSHIVPEGWNAWKGDAMFPDKEKTAYYAEYKSSGAGAAAAARAPWSHQLTPREARKYSVAAILKGRDNWNPLQ